MAADEDHAGDYDYPIDVARDGVTELVVHGWGSSGPAEVLDDPEVRQVAGSKLAGIWRGRDDPLSQRHREAYFWGGLTSRSWATALWFLLLPFAFTNMAGWMALGNRGQVRFQQAMVRVMAFCVTATYLLFLTQVFVDQAAWQCLAVTNCRVQPFWHALRMQDRPYLAAAAAALVPALFVLLLHLGTSPNRRWEVAAQGERAAYDLSKARLTDAAFWQDGAGYATQDRALHTAGAWTVLALVLLRTAATGGRASVAVACIELLLLAGLSVLACAALVDRLRAVLAGGKTARRVLCGGTGAVLVLAGVLCAVQPSGRRTGAAGLSRIGIGMPDLLDAFNLLLAVLYSAGVLMLAVALWAKRSTARRGLPRLPPAFSTVTVGSGLLFAIWSGVALSAAHWLSPPAKDATAAVLTQVQILPGSAALARFSIDGMAVLLFWFGAVWLWHRRDWEDTLAPELARWQERAVVADRAAELELTGPDAGPATDTGIWLAAVRRRKQIGTLLLRWLEGGLSGAAVLLAGAAIAFSCSYVLAWSKGPKPDVNLIWAGLPAPSATVAGAILLLGPLALLLVVRNALADPNTRKLTAIVWDIATFWPRSFHPYAPPSYAEQAVPQLTERVRHLTERGGTVVLLGHSQGAVIVTATVAQLAAHAEASIPRLSVVTYGNPVPRLYRRWFPTYLHAPLPVGGTTVTWANFHRTTDPFGGEALRDPNVTDTWLADPPTALRQPGSERPVIRGHHHRGYVRQSELARHLKQETDRLRSLPPPPEQPPGP
ncbi:PE-PPE domain-containing protein [Kitasatospora sp. NPDC002040]|uniref:PE-PPE domain-containing protein n=1 Tax=Kitasatospora sp. NPDC002040 TaxID=3154661 RepID=UPI003328D672